MKLSINSIDLRKGLALRWRLVKDLLATLDKNAFFFAFLALAFVYIFKLLKYGCDVLDLHV
jgi:hypothetical protein